MSEWHGEPDHGCGNPQCLCGEGPYGKPAERKWQPYTPAESRLLGVAVEEFAQKHGISLEEAEEEK